jgi:hypothetical protein
VGPLESTSQGRPNYLAPVCYAIGQGTVQHSISSFDCGKVPTTDGRQPHSQEHLVRLVANKCQHVNVGIDARSVRKLLSNVNSDQFTWSKARPIAMDISIPYTASYNINCLSISKLSQSTNKLPACYVWAQTKSRDVTNKYRR